MKNFIIGLLLVISIALGALTLQRQKQAAQTTAELAQVQKQLATAQAELIASADAAEQVARAKQSSQILKETLAKTSKFADEKVKEADAFQRSLAAAKTNTDNPMAGMMKMLNDPKMKEMIKSQQKSVMGPMLEKQYGALFNQLNMTPEESSQLKTLLLNKTLAGADAGMSMMDGSMDATKRAELTKQMKTERDGYDTQIKEFLGDAYPAYQSYEKTVPDRTVVNQFGDQLTGENAMNADQQAKLVQAMSDARTSFKWTTDYNKQEPPDGDFSAMFTADKLSQFTQEKEQFDQQFLAQAQKILTPAQATQFEEYQKAQRELQIMGMKMAAQMFAPKAQ